MLTADILVAASQGHKVEGLRKASTRSNWASLAAFQRCNVTAELRVDHSNFNMLDNHAANIADRFPRVVGYDNVSSDFFAVVVDFLVESHLKADFAVAESEALADQGAWQASSTGGWSMLQLNKKCFCNCLVILRRCINILEFFDV